MSNRSGLEMHKALWRAAGPVVEQLEARRLLSVTLLEGGIVRVMGTEGNDHVVISREPGNPANYAVVVNGELTPVPVNLVNQFQVNVLGGDDLVEITQAFGPVLVGRLINAGDGNDTVIGTDGDDIIHGGPGDDLLVGGAGNDWIFGEDGNDTLRGGEGFDYIDGGEGDDWIHGGMNGDTLLGGPGNDTIYGGRGHDSIAGAEGNDWLHGGFGHDTIRGGEGFDYLLGDFGDDLMFGGMNGDTMYGGPGNDTLLGGRGHDVLGGDAEDQLELIGLPGPVQHVGHDHLDGGEGHDTLLAHTGQDTLIGGDGNDIFDARGQGHVLVDRQPDETIPATAVFTENPVTVRHINLTMLVTLNEVAHQVRIPELAGHFPGSNSIAFALDEQGNIRFQDRIPGRQFRLGEFFQQWGKSFRHGQVGRYVGDMVMVVNNVPVQERQDYQIQDGDVITIHMINPVVI
jgi:hypothetical protein